MNMMINHPDLIRRRILRVHGSFLLVLTIISTVLAMVGWPAGKGPFALWQAEPFAAVGLFQAYLIMFVVGIALWFGSAQEKNLWQWDLVGLLAHLPPLAVNFIFADLFASYRFQSMSILALSCTGSGSASNCSPFYTGVNPGSSFPPDKEAIAWIHV